MATVIAFVRVGGNVVHQYGPKSFDKDWNGAFTGLQIVNLLAKLPKAPISEQKTPLDIRAAGRVAQAAKKEMLLEELRALTLNVDHILVTKEVTHWVWPDELSSEFLHLASAPEEPVVILTNGLKRMGLNTWGILNQICLALATFEAAPGDGGHLCTNINFTF
jgi:hypothetical protein